MRLNVSSKQAMRSLTVSHTSAGVLISILLCLQSYPLRPELIESTYLLHSVTGDPKYLQAGRALQETIADKTTRACGFATISDLATGEPMPSRAGEAFGLKQHDQSFEALHCCAGDLLLMPATMGIGLHSFIESRPVACHAVLSYP